MNIVTKSGTNELARQLVHADARHGDERQDRDREGSTTARSRTTAAISTAARSAGRSCKDKAHFFAAFERTQQDTFQVVDTLGLFPSEDGVFATPYRENAVHGEGHGEPQRRRTTCRSATAATRTRSRTAPTRQRRRAAGATARTSSTRSTSTTTGCSAASKLNEFIFQYADFSNDISANSTDPTQNFPNGVTIGQNAQHAADDPAEEVAVPRRLLVAPRRAWAASATTSRPASTTSTSRACSSRSTPARTTTPTPTSTTTSTGRSRP